MIISPLTISVLLSAREKKQPGNTPRQSTSIGTYSMRRERTYNMRGAHVVDMGMMYSMYQWEVKIVISIRRRHIREVQSTKEDIDIGEHVLRATGHGKEPRTDNRE